MKLEGEKIAEGDGQLGDTGSWHTYKTDVSGSLRNDQCLDDRH